MWARLIRTGAPTPKTAMNENDLPNFAKDLTLELTLLTGQTFQTIRDHRNAIIKGGGAWLALDIPWTPKGRIRIYASTPRAIHQRASERPEITVSADRPAEQIARDIVRRLLPAARDYFEKCRAYQRKADEDAAALRLLKHRLSPYLKPSWRSHYDTTRTTMHGPRVSADIVPHEILELRISRLSLDETVQILTILQCKNEPTPEE